MSDHDGEIVGRAVANPFSQQAAPAYAGGSLVSVEQQRAIAEVQARMIVARASPRDPIRCMDLILQDCTRKTMAETALYQYSRGGTAISGPSIRLAETMARRWGNIASGIKEVSRQDGHSECIAYAWDLESGYYDERQFQIRHWRDTKKGGYLLTDERDIYELIANMGQRRKRAVLLSVLPGDVIEAATTQCEETLRATADVTPEGIKRMVQSFVPFGVTREQIETRCQCHIEAIRPAQLVQLRKIYQSLKDGMSEPDDWFGPSSTVQGTAVPVAEPQRADFAARPPVEVEEEQPSFEVVALDGEVFRFDGLDSATEAVRKVLEGARRGGTKMLEAAIENNQSLILEAFDSGVDLIEEFRPADPPSARTESSAPVTSGPPGSAVPPPAEPARAPQVAATVRPPQPTAPTPEARPAPPPAAAAPASDMFPGDLPPGQRLDPTPPVAARPVTPASSPPAGTPANGTQPASANGPTATTAASPSEPPSERQSKLITPTPVRGKPDWRAWVRVLMMAKVRQQTNEVELAYLLGDNEANLEAARGSVAASDMAELDAAIDQAWKRTRGQ